MKTTFLKSRMPFALVAALGIAGAFATTSMQNASKSAAPKTGYINGPQLPCSVPVSCNTIPNQVCQASGQQAFGKANNCTEVLYRPQP